MNLKNIFILILSFINIISIHSQIEFAPIGADWIINNEVDFDHNPNIGLLESYHIISSEKDSIIDGMSFRKIGTQLFHQNGNQVYFLYADTLRLIYDFDLNVGDTVIYNMLSSCNDEIKDNQFVVSGVSYVDFDSFNLKKIECELVQGELPYEASPFTYMERIGSVRNTFEELAGCYFVASGNQTEQLRCYVENGIEYKSDWFSQFGHSNCEIITNTSEDQIVETQIELSPNPTYGTVDLADRYDQVIIYNTFGATIENYKEVSQIDISHLPKGVYYFKLNKDGKYYDTTILKM